MHYRYEKRLDNAHAAIINQVQDNYAVLLELAKSNSRLELSTGDKGQKLLAVKNATGWTSSDKRGVIEFR